MAYARTNTNDPSKPDYVRPEVIAAREDLDLIADLLAGTRRMWDMGQERGYIRKWTDEKASVYQIRRTCASVFEGLGRVLSAAVGMLWAKPPAIEWNAAEEPMEDHWANLDGMGTAGEVLCKRFTDQSIRDGLGVILVDHPTPPKNVAVTAELEEELNLRPTWALYPRGQVLGWRMGTINNRAEPVQVRLLECDYAPAGDYGVVERRRYRVLRLLTAGEVREANDRVRRRNAETKDVRALEAAPYDEPTDDTATIATWELLEEVKDASVVGGFKSIGRGVFRNRNGEAKQDLPIGVAYTGRTDAPFCASMPLLGVAFANLSHWQLSTELKFGRMVAAIEQPVVVGDLIGGAVAPDGTAIPATLKLGWLTGVRVAAGGDFKWAGPSGAGLQSLKEGVAEMLEQIGQMGMSFLVSDTRAAETAQAKLLDATAENSTLATAAQGVEDAINAALVHHAWYLGIEEKGAAVLTINKDFNATVFEPAVMLAYVQAAKEVGFPISILLREFQRGGRIPQDVDLDKLELEMSANAAAEEERKRQEAEDRAKQGLLPPGAPTGAGARE